MSPPRLGTTRLQCRRVRTSVLLGCAYYCPRAFLFSRLFCCGQGRAGEGRFSLLGCSLCRVRVRWERRNFLLFRFAQSRRRVRLQFLLLLFSFHSPLRVSPRLFSSIILSRRPLPSCYRFWSLPLSTSVIPSGVVLLRLLLSWLFSPCFTSLLLFMGTVAGRAVVRVVTTVLPTNKATPTAVSPISTFDTIPLTTEPGLYTDTPPTGVPVAIAPTSSSP